MPRRKELDFSDPGPAVQEDLSMDEDAIVEDIRRISRGDWRAAAWLLEHLYPDKWATADAAAPVWREVSRRVLHIVAETLGDDEYERVVDALSVGGENDVRQEGREEEVDGE